MYYLEMLDGWKRIIEMVKKPFPALIFRRLSKTDRVIFESVPLDKKHVLVPIFYAPLQSM